MLLPLRGPLTSQHQPAAWRSLEFLVLEPRAAVQRGRRKKLPTPTFTDAVRQLDRYLGVLLEEACPANRCWQRKVRPTSLQRDARLEHFTCLELELLNSAWVTPAVFVFEPTASNRRPAWAASTVSSRG